MGSDLYLSVGASDHPGMNEREWLFAELKRLAHVVHDIAHGRDDSTGVEYTAEELRAIAAEAVALRIPQGWPPEWFMR